MQLCLNLGGSIGPPAVSNYSTLNSSLAVNPARGFMRMHSFPWYLHSEEQFLVFALRLPGSIGPRATAILAYCSPLAVDTERRPFALSNPFLF